MKEKKSEVVWQEGHVSRADREKVSGHKGAVIWLTGLPCSGKTTIAHALEHRLHGIGCHTYVLDGDNVRHGLCSDLGFSDEERVENIRRVGEVASLFLDSGAIVITAFISPFRADRAQARALLPDGDFYEVFVNTPLELCESRDVKGMYKRARSGEIPSFSGVSSPYEPPETPELEIKTESLSIEEGVDKVIALLKKKAVISLD